MSSQPVETRTTATRGQQRMIIGAIALVLLIGLVMVLSLRSGEERIAVPGDSTLLVLALPAFLTGVLSFLSPCTLPILPAYFAFTFQAGKKNIFSMSVAFFFGLATTLTLLGASTTALSGLLFDNKDSLTFWGGMVVIAFGVMGIFGLGFAGPQINERPAATLAGSYLYGATFALGWTACIGPILGALLTLLASASSGLAIVQGGVLAFIYALGLGTPLIIIATYFNRLGTGSPFWKAIKGRSFSLNLFGRTIELHTTSVASGLLMIVMGVLLASGRLEIITQQFSTLPISNWWVEIETALSRWFGF